MIHLQKYQHEKDVDLALFVFIPFGPSVQLQC